MIQVTCPGCGNEFNVADSQAGKQGRCLKCGVVISASIPGDYVVKLTGPAAVAVPPTMEGVSVPATFPTRPRFCSGCGGPLNDEAWFCSGCGAQVGAGPSPILRVIAASVAATNARNLKYGCGIAGAIMLILGPFLPMALWPLGSVNFFLPFGDGQTSGELLVFLGLGTLLFTLLRNYDALWLTGVGSVVLLAVHAWVVLSFAAEDGGLEYAQVGWGWVVLLLGAALAIAAAALQPSTFTRGDLRSRLASAVPRRPGATFWLALGGAAMLILGSFAPLAFSMNLYTIGKMDGASILVLSAGAVIFALLMNKVVLWFAGLASLGLLAFDYNELQGLFEDLGGTFHMQWGWAVLFLGAAMVIGAAAIPQPKIVRNA